MIQAGQLRHRVTLQARSLAPDSFGQPVETWSDVGTFWAMVRPLRGREGEAIKQVRSEATHKVVLRGVARITPDMRLVFKGRVLDILEALDVDERGRELNLTCVERY